MQDDKRLKEAEERVRILLAQGAVPISTDPGPTEDPDLSFRVFPVQMKGQPFVILEFSKQINWMGMSPEQARMMAKTLREVANLSLQQERQEKKKGKK